MPTEPKPGPIRPAEVEDPKIPPEVFRVFNDAIRSAWDGREAVVYQDRVAPAVAVALGIETEDLYDRRLLDVEPYYRDAGWFVKYDRPAYNETGRSYFTFKKGK